MPLHDTARHHPLDDLWTPSSYYRPSTPSIYVIEPHEAAKKAAEDRDAQATRRHRFGFGVREESEARPDCDVLCVACTDGHKPCICGARPPRVRELVWPGA